MIHALTIDVEDYHSVIGRDWLGRDGPPTRAVVDNTRRMLDWVTRSGARCTCFILGEVARSFPDLVREIAAGGHEIGVHGDLHRQVFKLSPDEFRREVSDARKSIEEASGAPVLGHRAPAFSIMPQTAWALDVLAEMGFDYDSSIFPIRGRRYGWPGFRPDIHMMRLPSGRQIIEAPMSTVRLFGKALPACGGGYLRHFPLSVTRWAMRRIERERPAIMYLHPYEIELPCGPLETDRLDAGAARRARRFHALQRRNRHTVERKLQALLSEFRFAPLRDVIQATVGAMRTTNEPPRVAAAMTR